jgi:hypothetical protein
MNAPSSPLGCVERAREALGLTCAAIMELPTGLILAPRAGRSRTPA